MNKVILMGRLTRDPGGKIFTGCRTFGDCQILHLRSTNALSVRVNRTQTLYPCVAFGKQGEFAEKYLQKRSDGKRSRKTSGP